MHANLPAMTERSHRIAVALPSLLPFGGVERVRIALIREFQARGHAVDLVLAKEPSKLTGIVPDGVRTFEFGAARLRHFVGPFARYLRSEKPDAVLAAIWPLTSLCIVAHRLARSSGDIVVSDHNILSVQYAGRGRAHRLALRASLRATYPFADACVAVSHGVADDLAALSGIARSRFTVIQNPMPLPDINAEPATAEAAWGGWAGRRVITVGSLKAQKNHALLIRAFKRLLHSTDARLMILGSGPLEDTTKALVVAEGLAGKVLMPGHVADPIPFYRSADLFGLSSDYEGFGNVIVEALACGVPVVSTDCPSGPSEILENGRWGQLVPVGDEIRLAATMAEALGGVHDREALKRRAVDFAPARAAQKYLDLMFPNDGAAPAIAAMGADA